MLSVPPGLETAVARELAAARSDPKSVVARLQSTLKNYTGKTCDRGEGRPMLVTHEGAAAVRECIAELALQPACSERLAFSRELANGASTRHARDIGASGSTSHAGSDGSRPSERCTGWTECVGECLWFGEFLPGESVESCARAVVDGLLVDDGVPDRGHRRCVLEPKYRLVGVAAARHAVYGLCVVVNYAGGFDPSAAAAAPRPAPAAAPAPKPAAPAASERSRTKWDLGACAGCGRVIEGGTTVTALGKTWHKACFACAGCRAPLGGTFKAEAGEPFCDSCHADRFAAKCAACGEPITSGSVIKLSAGTYHAACVKCGCGSVVKPTNGRFRVDAAGKPLCPACAQAPRTVAKKPGRGGAAARAGPKPGRSMAGARNAMDDLARQMRDL